jgi:hypothetical protein
MRFPRLLLDRPVELEIGKDTIRIENPTNNVSIGGLFVRRGHLPVGAPVHIRISGRNVFEADGQIRHSEPNEFGAGIRFTSLSEPNRVALNELIEDLTGRGLAAA